MEATTVLESEPEQRTLFVGDLAEDTHEDDVFNAFAIFGEVVNVTIKSSYSAKGDAYAFVQFARRGEAEAALQRCKQKTVKVHHSVVSANWYRRKAAVAVDGQDGAEREELQTSTKLWVGNLPLEATQTHLYSAFSVCGQVVDIHMCKLAVGSPATVRCAFVTFASRAEAEGALQRCMDKSLQVLSTPVRAKWPNPPRTSTSLASQEPPAREDWWQRPVPQDAQKREEGEEMTSLWLGDLPMETTQMNVTEVFSAFGEVLEVKMCEPKPAATKQCGFVRFRSRGEAEEALRHCQDKEVQVLGVPVLARPSGYPPRRVAGSSVLQVLGPGLGSHPQKTRLCGWSQLRSGCKFRDCHNAHSEEELRAGWKAHMGSQYDEEMVENFWESSEEAIVFFKTKECPNLAQWGACVFSEWCHYAHAAEEIGPQPLQSTRLNMPEDSDLGRKLEHAVYKTISVHMGSMRIFHLRLTLQWWMHRPTRGLDLRRFLEDRPHLFLVQGHVVHLASPLWRLVGGPSAASQLWGQAPQAPSVGLPEPQAQQYEEAQQDEAQRQIEVQQQLKVQQLEVQQQVQESPPEAHQEVQQLEGRLEEQEVAQEAVKEEIHEEEEQEEEAPQQELQQEEHEVQQQEEHEGQQQEEHEGQQQEENTLQQQEERDLQQQEEPELQQQEEQKLQQELREGEEVDEAQSDASSESSDEEEVLWPLAGKPGQNEIRAEEAGPEASEALPPRAEDPRQEETPQAEEPRDTPEGPRISWETLIDAAAVSTEQRDLAKGCLAEIQACLAEKDPGCSIQPFGSMETGLGTAGCDLDLSIKKTCLGTQRDGHLQVLGSLQDQLLGAESRRFAKIKLVSARVPVLKIWYAGQLEVDITVNNTDGVSNTRLLRMYADMHPSLRRLVLFVKLWAKAEGLCGAPDGHLSSYAWALMAIYFLRAAHRLPRPSEAGVRGVELPALADLLVGFFRFYASEFRWGAEVASERRGRVEEAQDPGQVFSHLEYYYDGRLYIEDPQLPRRNLADVLRQDGGEQKEARLRERIQQTAEALESGRHQEIMEMCFTAPQAPWELPRSAALEMASGEAASTAPAVPAPTWEPRLPPGLCSPPSSSPASSASSPRQAVLAPATIAGAGIQTQPEHPQHPQLPHPQHPQPQPRHPQSQPACEMLAERIGELRLLLDRLTCPEKATSASEAGSPEYEVEDAADVEDEMPEAEGLLQVEDVQDSEVAEDFELPTEQLELWAQHVVRQKGSLRMPLLVELLAWWRWAPNIDVAQFVKDRPDMFEVDGDVVSLSPPKAYLFQ